MGILFDFLVDRFFICAQKHNISVIDYFKLYKNINVYQSALVDFEKKHTNDQNDQLSPLEKYVLMIECDPLRKLACIFSQNHLVNYIQDIFLILSNPILSEGSLFNILYENKSMIHEVAAYIISIWKIIINDNYEGVELKKFYNQKMVDMFIANTVHVKLENMGDRYNELWDNHFVPATLFIKTYLESIRHLFATDDQCEYGPGLSNFNPDLYKYMFKLNVGLDLDSKVMITYAYQCLKQNLNRCTMIGKLLYGIDNIPYDILDSKILSENDQKFTSDAEIIDTYDKCMKMYRKIYVVDQNFPMSTDVKLFSFDNPSLAGGMYEHGIFYLNLANRDTMRRYDVESLVLHETIPGHHLQINISTYSKDVDPLTFIYGSMMNGFAEGWGLVAESMFDRSKLLYKQGILNEYGRIQMNILRTYRVIADIKLHVYGAKIKDVICEMKKYVKTSNLTINSEIYRYMAIPGQAPCYKLGEIILERTDRANYKSLMINGWVPLCFIKI